jgi:hypothetical protein
MKFRDALLVGVNFYRDGRVQFSIRKSRIDDARVPRVGCGITIAAREKRDMSIGQNFLIDDFNTDIHLGNP